VARLKDAANLGWVRPPLIHASAIIAGAVLTWLWPLPFALPAARPIGGAMVLASIYVAFFVLQLGIALLTGSLWIVATLIPAAALVCRVVVPREERYLGARFGQHYDDYRNCVRRWL